jgi:hypothetical protein
MLDIVNESVMLLKKLANLVATEFIVSDCPMYWVIDCTLSPNTLRPIFCVNVLNSEASLLVVSVIPNESATVLSKEKPLVTDDDMPK